jgi:hypothetical protein
MLWTWHRSAGPLSRTELPLEVYFPRGRDDARHDFALKSFQQRHTHGLAAPSPQQTDLGALPQSGQPGEVRTVGQDTR